MLTPIIVMISSWLIGTFLLMRVEGGQLLAMAIGAAISIAYIVVASRR